MKENYLSQASLPSTDREDILTYLRDIIKDVLKNKDCDIYLFGSWARNEEKRTSDIDIAIDPKSEISEYEWVQISERIEESYLPYRVDVINLPKANKAIKDKVLKEGVLWTD